MLVTRCSCVSRVGCRKASGIVSDLSWCQKLSEVRSKLFLHEHENKTHQAEQALLAWRGAGRSCRGTRPLLSTSDGVHSCRIALRCLLLYCWYQSEFSNIIIVRKTELCHHRPQTNAHSNEYENNTHKAEQSLPVWRAGGGSNMGTRPLLSSSDGARSCRIRLRCPLLYC